MGLRLQLRRQQAEAGDIVLLFVDEADFLNVPYLTRMWAKQGADLRVGAPGKVKRRCVSGARDACTGHLLAQVSQTKKTQDLLNLIDLIEQTYQAWLKQPVKKGRAPRQVVLVLDNGPSHTSHATQKALAQRSAWLSVEWLPKFSPELNDIERDWRVLKSRYLGNRNFLHEWDLERCVLEAIAHLNQQRALERKQADEKKQTQEKKQADEKKQAQEKKPEVPAEPEPTQGPAVAEQNQLV